MATTLTIKRRIKTAKNIGQVTRAMEMVSAVKMKKAQETAVSGRPYVRELEKMLRILASEQDKDNRSRYLNLPKKVGKILVLVIAPKKGLCGPLTTNLYRKINQLLSGINNGEELSRFLYYPDSVLSAPETTTKGEITFVAFEKKASDTVRLLGKPLLADFQSSDRTVTPETVRPVADFLVSQFDSGGYDLVLVAYTHFESTVTQKAVIRQFLPVFPKVVEESEKSEKATIIYEPGKEEIISVLVPRYIEAVLYQTMLESLASEHSARMVAMKNASDNAKDIVSDLTLFYNKARQGNITNELLDSVSSQFVGA